MRYKKKRNFPKEYIIGASLSGPPGWDYAELTRWLGGHLVLTAERAVSAGREHSTGDTVVCNVFSVQGHIVLCTTTTLCMLLHLKSQLFNLINVHFAM